MPLDLSGTTASNAGLLLSKFTWVKERQTDTIEFTPGLNLLAQGDQTERTTILRLIRYAMGGSHGRIGDDVTRITKEVRLEFMANGTLISTRRGVEHPDGKFTIATDAGGEGTISPSEMGEFLLDTLGIPRVRYQAGDRRNLLSFNDLARAFVVDRDFSYTEIMAKMYPDPRKETVKLMLGLTTQEMADAEEELRSAELKVQRLNEEIRGIERLLKDFQIGNILDIEQRRANLSGLLGKVDAEENALRETIQKAATEGLAESAEGSRTEYQSLHDELLVKRSRLSDIDGELAVLEKQTTEKSGLRSLLEGEVHKIERRSSSHYVLSSFTFSRCPRCLQDITSEMKEREHQDNCMLCGRPLDAEREDDPKLWNKALVDAKKAVQEADQLLEYYSSRRQLLQRERADMHERVSWLEAELSRQTVRYVSPLVENLSLINERRAQLLKSLAAVDLDARQRSYADRLRDEELPELKSMREAVQDKIDVLQVTRGEKGARINAFLEHFTYFMRNTASDQFRSASWDGSELLPMINDQDYFKALSGFDLTIAVLAFHYALLALRFKSPAFLTSHPGLLMVDEPKQQMMDSRQYRSIMRLFAELAGIREDGAQIIIAATDAHSFESFRQIIQTASN